MSESMHAVESPPPVVPPASDLGFDDFSAEFENLPIPCMDSLFDNDALPSEAFASDLEFGFDFGDNGEFEITFDDLDSICIPSDADDFLLPDACNPNGASISPSIDDPGDSPAKNFDYHITNSDSLDSGTSAVSGDRSSGVSRFFNSQALDSVSIDNSGKQGSHNSVDVKVSSSPSPESESSDREESSDGPVSSQGSGNGGSGVYEAMNSPSLDSGRYERDITSSHGHAVMDKSIKLEEIGVKGCDLKRKKECCEGSAENRTTKYRRSSSVALENKTQEQSQSGVNAIDDEDEKRKARLMRNRESAQLSRQRKKHYVEELEEKVRSMHSTITDLSSKISFVMAENATLRQQLGAGVMCPPPPPAPGMYPHPPMAPMPYPWMPCAPYVVKPQGSQVPLVPIPRLKSQQPVAASKSKKNEGKKTEVKTKKVASISLLGLFFFIMLFGGLVPLVDVKFEGLVNNVPSGYSYVSDRLYGQGGGKVWPVNGGHINGSERIEEVGFSSGGFGVSDRINYERGRKLGEETHEWQDPNSFVHRGNASEPLVASLYVPRNDKLVKIDGNLIIHSIMASEKAMASQTAEAKKDKRETGLAIPTDWDSALAIPQVGRNRGQHPHVYRVSPEQRKALGSGSTKALKDHMKSSATDGKMQQWFREGLAGPMLSSGMCTEVFQFDVSPTPGAIVPATSVANISTENRRNATSGNKTRNRRILHGLPDPFAGSSLNITEEHVRNSHKDHLHGNKSSTVVSVLVDPKEAGDGDVDGVVTPKSLSRIFVVVLMDSVKYVTYSCGLPRVSPHLVTAYV
ncbi:bZIP transcription factor 17-like [Abrus precatorius]|uniref:BZIP transcription factor 17-like n=1 Tax=Abrus precatorius TaxID=3816 RepID=A0A8B8L0R0_ABRPR|nr:bZIP transcription factor 17-like [Abrus precatorius]